MTASHIKVLFLHMSSFTPLCFGLLQLPLFILNMMDEGVNFISVINRLVGAVLKRKI